MIGFGIDQVQAEFVAEIKLRNLNREHILRRLEETKELEREIADLQDILAHRRRIRAIIADELRQVKRSMEAPAGPALFTRTRRSLSRRRRARRIIRADIPVPRRLF
jgi:DNA gyrase subunit A